MVLLLTVCLMMTECLSLSLHGEAYRVCSDLSFLLHLFNGLLCCLISISNFMDGGDGNWASRHIIESRVMPRLNFRWYLQDKSSLGSSCNRKCCCLQILSTDVNWLREDMENF